MSKKVKESIPFKDAKPVAASKKVSNSSLEAVSECSGGIKISIDAKPGAKQNSIVRIEDGAVTVQIAARAVDGAANAELIEYVAEVIGTRRQTLSIVSGQQSRQKVLLLSAQCGMSPSEILKRFTDAIS